MFRRLLVFSVITYASLRYARAYAKRKADEQKDRHAEANWDTEGGTPPPDPVDTPALG